MRITVTLGLQGNPRRQVMRWSGPAATYNEAAKRAMPALRTLWAAMTHARGATGAGMPAEVASPKPTFKVEQSRHGEGTTWTAGLALCDALGALPAGRAPELPDLRAAARSLMLTHYARRLLTEAPRASASAASAMHGNGRLKDVRTSVDNLPLRVDRRSCEAPDGDLTEALLALEAVRRMAGGPAPLTAAAICGIPDSATLRAAIASGRTELFEQPALGALQAMGLAGTAGEIEARNADLRQRVQQTRALLAAEPAAREYRLRLAMEGCRSYATGMSDDAAAAAKSIATIRELRQERA